MILRGKTFGGVGGAEFRGDARTGVSDREEAFDMEGAMRGVTGLELHLFEK